MTDTESDRCGYRLEIDQTDSRLATEPCPRPVWETEDEAYDRCVWHATVDGKTQTQLESAGPASEGSIDGAYLREASLTNVDWFAGTSMIGVDLTGADLKGSDFRGTDFTLSRLTDVSAIATDFSDANLEGVILTNADLRQASLEGARLHDTVLTDLHVGSGTTIGDVAIYDRDDAPPDLTDEQPLEAAAWVYRQLQRVYQDNSLPELARRSYYMERNARRRLAWGQSELVKAFKWEASRWIMRYGSSPYRVLLTSMVVIVAAAILYPLTGGIQEIEADRAITYSIEDPERASRWWIGQVFFKSLYFSVVTFATLGYGDIQPVGTVARFLAGVESILGALLAALLVFVLARNVTW